MKTTIVWLCVFQALSGVALAEESASFDRMWGFGWDSGLSLRRQLGDWQIGLSAGPNDYRNDQAVDRFDPDFPDSLNGSLYRENNTRRESGFVYLEVARELATRRNIEFSGTVGGLFTWSDFKRDEASYDIVDGKSSLYASEYFTKEWRLLAGVKIAWFVTPWLSLEKKFGLVYQWLDSDQTDWRKYANDSEWTRDVITESYQSFNSYGDASLYYDVRIIFWF